MEQKKKVLFTATVDSHIIHFHLPFLKLFKEKGYEVHVATNGKEEIPYCDVKHTVFFERSPIKINNLKAIRELKKIIDKEKFDIIHCHTPMGSVVTRLAAKKARKKYRTRVIYTAHGFHFFKGAPLKNWLLFYPVEKYLAKYTDTLITINKEDYNLAKNKFSKRCHDIEYVPGVGIDEKKFNIKMTKKEKIELRKSLGLKEDDFVLIYVARMDKNKNQGFLIEVMRSLVKVHNNIHLLLVGPDENNGKYQAQAKDLLNNIHFLGFRKDIPQLMKISDVAVSSSLREGLPVNIMEALTVGLPVVATEARGIDDLIADNKKSFIVKKNDSITFKKSIINIFKLKKKNDTPIEMMKRYHINNIIKKYEKIYFRKKKVLHILSSNRYSGAENVACTIIENMSDIYDMYYCSPEGPIRETLKDKNIKYVPIEKLSIGCIKKVKNRLRPDIIHAHDNKATIISSFFGKKMKVISHIHGNNKIMNTLNLKTILFNICSRNIKEYIWVSDSSLNDYYFNKKVKNKSIILYNVVDQKEIIKKSKEYTCDEQHDLIFLGRLGYPKNPQRFIEIIRKIKEKNKKINVAIVGDGPDKEVVKDLINKYSLEKNIKMYGFVKNPYPILKNSKLLIMTSIYEGTPMCALEAQALGKPVIATPVDGLKKIIKNNCNGFLSNNDIDLALAIIRFLRDDNYSKITNKVKRCFNEYNNIKVYFKKINNIYEERN